MGSSGAKLPTESGTGVDRPPGAFSMSFVKERGQNVARLPPEPQGNTEQKGDSHCRGGTLSLLMLIKRLSSGVFINSNMQAINHHTTLYL